MIGDVIGKPGRVAVERDLPGLREERGIDFVTANGENLAGGMGLTVVHRRGAVRRRRRRHHAAATTSGTSARSTRTSTRASASCGRSTTARTSVPGRGWGTYHALDGTELAVINLQGRTYMQPIENPFTDADRLLDEAREPLPPIRLVDFHCELTSEKNALGLYLDGRVSASSGTHTHVVTGDERILPRGTAYLSDLGHDRAARGASSASTRRPSCRASSTRCRRGSRSATGPVVFNACQIDIDPATGRALAIERIQRLVEV